MSLLNVIMDATEDQLDLHNKNSRDRDFVPDYGREVFLDDLKNMNREEKALHIAALEELLDMNLSANEKTVVDAFVAMAAAARYIKMKEIDEVSDEIYRKIKKKANEFVALMDAVSDGGRDRNRGGRDRGSRESRGRDRGRDSGRESGRSYGRETERDSRARDRSRDTDRRRSDILDDEFKPTPRQPPPERTSSRRSEPKTENIPVPTPSPNPKTKELIYVCSPWSKITQTTNGFEEEVGDSELKRSWSTVLNKVSGTVATMPKNAREIIESTEKEDNNSPLKGLEVVTNISNAILGARDQYNNQQENFNRYFYEVLNTVPSKLATLGWMNNVFCNVKHFLELATVLGTLKSKPDFMANRTEKVVYEVVNKHFTTVVNRICRLNIINPKFPSEVNIITDFTEDFNTLIARFEKSNLTDEVRILTNMGYEHLEVFRSILKEQLEIETPDKNSILLPERISIDVIDICLSDFYTKKIDNRKVMLFSSPEHGWINDIMRTLLTHESVFGTCNRHLLLTKDGHALELGRIKCFKGFDSLKGGLPPEWSVELL